MVEPGAVDVQDLLTRVRAHASYESALAGVVPQQPLWQAIVIFASAVLVMGFTPLLPFVVDRRVGAAVVFVIVFELVMGFVLYIYWLGFRQRRRGKPSSAAAAIVERDEHTVRVGRNQGSQYFVTIDRGTGSERHEVWSGGVFDRATPGSGGIAYFRGDVLVDYARLVDR